MTGLSLTRPAAWDWIFALKTFASAMAALWIALRLGLDRPYWAMATAYIVAQPLSGATRSKAAYRLYGTLLGGVVTIAMLPNLIDAPEVLSAALLLWLGVCVYLAALDRTPRSYVFQLAGYGLAILGLPAVDAPGEIWNIVLSRVEEIGIGIACATLISSVIFPRPLGAALTVRMDAWIGNAAAWSRAVLSGAGESAELCALRRRIGADLVTIGMLATQLSYDTLALRVAVQPVFVLRQRVALLAPVLESLTDRLHGLLETVELRRIAEDIDRWIGLGPHAELATTTELHRRIVDLTPPADARSDADIALAGALLHLSELVDLVHDIIALRRHVTAAQSGLPALAIALPHTGAMRHHRDHLLAFHAALATAAAMAAVIGYWIAAAWPDGASAAVFAGIACAFFASQDNPATGVAALIAAAMVALLIDAWLLFAVLPLVHGFEALMLAFAPVFLPFSVLASMPATAAFGTVVPVLAATELALSTSYSADFPTYVNGAAAAIVGLAIAAIVLSVVRSAGVGWAAARLVHQNRADIAAACHSQAGTDRLALATLLLERLSLLVPRLTVRVDGIDLRARMALADLRVGLAVVELETLIDDLNVACRHSVARLLAALGEHYRRTMPPDAALWAEIGQAVATFRAETSAAGCLALLCLDGIGRALAVGYATPAAETSVE